MANQTSTSLPFIPSFNTDRPGLPGAGLSWLKDLREEGIERFSALGLPTPKQELWKYTRLKPLEDTLFQPVSEQDGMAVLDSVPSLLPDPGGRPRLVFVNGRIRPTFWVEGDLPEGVRIECDTELQKGVSGEGHRGRGQTDGRHEDYCFHPHGQHLVTCTTVRAVRANRTCSCLSGSAR